MTLRDKVVRLLADNPQAFQTPSYVYDVDTALRNYRELKAALGTRLVVSLKANPCPELWNRCLHEFTDGIEVASLAELNLVVSGGGRRFVNSPAADQRFLRGAVAAGALPIVDNLAQLELLATLVRGPAAPPLLLRLNVAAVVFGSEQRATLDGDHFGMDFPTALEAIARAHRQGLSIQGVHLFGGSWSFTKKAHAILDAAKSWLLPRLAEALHGPVRFLNLGGGFSESWRASDFDFAAYREALATLPAGIDVAHESGRGIFASAGAFLTKVTYLKELSGRSYCICDGGIAQNFLLAQTERAIRHLKIPRVLPAATRAPLAVETLAVGSSCSKDDLIGRLPVGTPAAKPGDLLIFDDCGAYNSTYTAARFLSLPEAKEYILVKEAVTP